MSKERFVYFVQQGADGPIKIGTAVDVVKRLDHLMAANSAELVVRAIIPGGAEIEGELHIRFARHVIRGEWFRPDPEIVEYMASLPAVLLRDLKYRRKYKALLPLDEAKVIWDNPELTSQEARALLTGWSHKRISALLGPRRFDYRGRNSAANGRKNKSKGRSMVEFTPDQLREAKRIWRDTVEYPTWEAARDALAEIVTEKGEKFTTDRARRLWKSRKSKSR